ncbi:MAG: DUF3574 domain-containing protein [Alphaproteobacteria bacterium]|nr:DUF3574 domain-containing protein [Alphaproteobacteria bacterium]
MSIVRSLILALIVLWPAPASQAADLPPSTELVCRAGEDAWLSTSLFFGRSISGGGMVSDTDWIGFVEAEITPRFPAGFTVIDANGFWRTSDGGLGREQSKVLIVLHPQKPTRNKAFEEIISVYKTRFRQRSVLKSVSAACVKF